MPQIASGILFNSFEAHYRRINTIKFTPDGAGLITASEDSGVSVWSVPRYPLIACIARRFKTNLLLLRLLDNLTQYEIPTPYCALSDHTLPVTDVVVGVGAFPHCRVLTSSLDNSCKASPSMLKPCCHTYKECIE